MAGQVYSITHISTIPTMPTGYTAYSSLSTAQKEYVDFTKDNGIKFLDNYWNSARHYYLYLVSNNTTSLCTFYKSGTTCGVITKIEDSQLGILDEDASYNSYSGGAPITSSSGYYTRSFIDSSTNRYTLLVNYYDSYNEAYSALESYTVNFPITYRLTNCTAPTAPTEAAVGDTVTVPFQFTTGYGIVNPSSDVYVTNNGVVVPSQYSNGVLTFTMPDPS